MQVCQTNVPSHARSHAPSNVLCQLLSRCQRYGVLRPGWCDWKKGRCVCQPGFGGHDCGAIVVTPHPSSATAAPTRIPTERECAPGCPERYVFVRRSTHVSYHICACTYLHTHAGIAHTRTDGLVGCVGMLATDTAIMPATTSSAASMAKTAGRGLHQRRLNCHAAAHCSGLPTVAVITSASRRRAPSTSATVTARRCHRCGRQACRQLLCWWCRQKRRGHGARHTALRQ